MAERIIPSVPRGQSFSECYNEYVSEIHGYFHRKTLQKKDGENGLKKSPFSWKISETLLFTLAS
jgi:hypothetical protein